MFAAIDAGTITGAVYGLGKTEAEALADARENGAEGALRAVRCTPKAAKWIEDRGGEPSGAIHVTERLVCTTSEAEA